MYGTLSQVKNSPKKWLLGVSCYHRLEELRQFLQILNCVDFLEIYVWEGLSRNSETLIRPYLKEQLRLGAISGFFSFEGNIGANCPRLASQVLIDQGDYELVTITNPDLIFNPSILEEIRSILQSYPEVFTVSAGVSKENLPESVADRYPEERVVPGKPYNLFKSGAHLTTFRASEFQGFCNWRRAVGIPFVDRSFETYGAYVKKKVSACTKRYRATHTGWYITEDPEYKKLKIENSRRNFWWLNLESSFAFYKSTKKEYYLFSDSQEYFTPIRWHSIILKNDLHNECSLRIVSRWVEETDVSKKSVNILPGDSFEYKIYLFGEMSIHRVDGVNGVDILSSVFLSLKKESLNLCLRVSSI